MPVHAHWEPIADATFNMHNDSPQLAEMFDLSPCYPVKEYRTEDFKVFLPPSTVAVGDVWSLDPNSIVPFLYQFHPGARTDLGNGEAGAYACLRAYASDYAEISFRIHAEFTLGSDVHQEWQQENAEEEWERESEAKFIPSQYVGRVLVNLKNGTIRVFSLALPARNSNVDINACGGADMVFVPRMELLATDETDRDEIAWDTTITVEEARRSLALKFYQFAKIDWLPIESAVERAKATHRPIHAILVWGCLDDESC
ncbi:hypothetical protein J5I95_16675 [Candidatus Poribacteria bacterium]|nr:hypothetical protein [Candidatus Poribacteria bacterium]